MDLTITVRADVLEAVTHLLSRTETLADVVEDLSYWEASARKRYAGSSDDESAPIDCTMTSPVQTVVVDVPEGPVEMLCDSMRPGETFDSLITALLIAEVRHRRTHLHWQIVSADEPIMTDEARLIAALMQHDDSTITTTTGGHLMYTITTEVPEDLLDAFDSTLDDWEDRSEEIAALIHLEDDVRALGASLANASPVPTTEPTATIEVALDPHDHAALERILGGDDSGALLTALMSGAVNGNGEAIVSGADSLPLSV